MRDELPCSSKKEISILLKALALSPVDNIINC